jgi:hypothetical protein
VQPVVVLVGLVRSGPAIGRLLAPLIRLAGRVNATWQGALIWPVRSNRPARCRHADALGHAREDVAEVERLGPSHGNRLKDVGDGVDVGAWATAGIAPRVKRAATTADTRVIVRIALASPC